MAPSSNGGLPLSQKCYSVELFPVIGIWNAQQVPPLVVILVTLAQEKVQRFLLLDKKMVF